MSDLPVKRIVAVLEDGGRELTKLYDSLQAQTEAKADDYELIYARDSHEFREKAAELLQAEGSASDYDISVLSDGNMPKEGFIGTVNSLNQLVSEFPEKLKSVYLALRTSGYGLQDTFQRASEKLSKDFLNSLETTGQILGQTLSQMAAGPSSGNPTFLRPLIEFLGDKIGIIGKNAVSVDDAVKYAIERNI